jgi:hypothetical protein
MGRALEAMLQLQEHEAPHGLIDRRVAARILIDDEGLEVVRNRPMWVRIRGAPVDIALWGLRLHSEILAQMAAGAGGAGGGRKKSAKKGALRPASRYSFGSHGRARVVESFVFRLMPRVGGRPRVGGFGGRGSAR